MKYVKVDSSQIAEVGYGEGFYGPETLALRFPPTKKQKAAGEPGSEYHYQNVTPEMHQEFMAAESIGSYFGRNIKPFPEKYPFTKVEADPQHPAAKASESASGKSGNDTTRTKASQQPSPDTDGDAATDQPSPGTALALIDGMADDKLFSPGSITDAQLATMRSDWLAEAKMYDIATDKARTELKRFARPLQKLRTGIEARAKELTGATKRKIAAIDTEKRRLVLVVGGIEDEVLAPLTAWEQEEETRKTTLRGIVSGIMAKQTFYPDISSLSAAIAELEAFDLSTMQEFKVSAESAIIAVLRVLKPNLASMETAVAERVELEKLRAANIQRQKDEAEREQKRQEDARVASAAEKLAAEKIQAAVDAAKVETRQEVIAELQAESGEPEDGDNEVSEPLENAGYYPEAPGIVYPVPAPPLTHETHEQHINAQAVAAFMGHCGYTRQQAIAGLTAITKRLIPHVSITY
jgi:hypothetical protein